MDDAGPPTGQRMTESTSKGLSWSGPMRPRQRDPATRPLRRRCVAADPEGQGRLLDA